MKFWLLTPTWNQMLRLEEEEEEEEELQASAEVEPQAATSG